MSWNLHRFALARCAGHGSCHYPVIRRQPWWEGREGSGRRTSSPERRKVYHSSVRPVLVVILGILVAVAGGIWILQGLNVIVSDSFMTGSRTWIVIGAATVVGGLWLSWRGWSRR